MTPVEAAVYADATAFGRGFEARLLCHGVNDSRRIEVAGFAFKGEACPESNSS
jgi:hypothetical protein